MLFCSVPFTSSASKHWQAYLGFSALICSCSWGVSQHDTIKIYSTKGIASSLSISRGGLILMGLLIGGDYDPVCDV